MFRIAGIAFAITLSATIARAEDLEPLKAQYYELSGACRIGELNGQAISQAESEKACADLDPIGKKLQAAGQCWDSSEQVWDKCPVTN